jgi:type I restriction enzyme M protein
VEQAEEHAAELRTLTDHHHVSALKNNRGRLSLKAVRDRLAATNDAAERATLTRYLEADRQQKGSSREAADLLAGVEAQYRERLEVDPVPEELTDLHAAARYLELLDEQTALRSEIREADAALDLLAYEKYPTLTEAEIKTLVVDDKWMAHLSAAVRGELEQVSQTLTGRVRELAERYATPLPQLSEEVEALSARVEEHLARMGAAWR